MYHEIKDNHVPSHRNEHHLLFFDLLWVDGLPRMEKTLFDQANILILIE